MSVQEAEGTKIEKYYSKAVSYAAMAAVAAVIQIFSLIQQMEYTPTPSVRLVRVVGDLSCNDDLMRV